MAVAVQQAGRKEDDLTTILKGVQLASGILGLKEQIQGPSDAQLQREASQQELMDLQIAKEKSAAEERGQLSKGILTPTSRLQFGTNYQEVDPGTEGALGGFRTPEGQEISFMPRTQIEADRKYNAAESKKKEDANKLAEKIARDKKGTQTKIEGDLRKSYWTEGAKETAGAIRGFQKVKAAATTPSPTGVDDIALIFGFMKTIDPTSTVREGEFATAQNSGSVPETIRARYNQIVGGDKLTSDQRSNFLNAAATQLKSQLEVQKGIDERYTDLAKRAEADVEDVIDPGFSKAYEEVSQILGGNQNLMSEFNTAPSPGSLGVPGEQKATAESPENIIDKFLTE